MSTHKIIYSIVVLGAVVLTSCKSKQETDKPRIVHPHTPLTVVNPNASASSINIGTIYLEAQMQPLQVGGVSLQAGDVSQRGGHLYVSYSSVDAGTVAVKKGAIEHVEAYACVGALPHQAFCLRTISQLTFNNADILATHSDGTNLFAVGAIDDDSSAPNFARLYKISLHSTTKAMQSITGTLALPSYTGTGVLSLGSTVLVTSGTSTDSTAMGGFSVVNSSAMTINTTKPLYDARSLAMYSGASTAFVTRGRVDGSTPAAVVEYNTSGAGSALRTINTGGNTIPESKGSIQVGNQLILVSAGDGGFKVLCKATGNTLLTQAAVTVGSIPAAKTVTNSVVAAPGFIFAANGEAGLYVYKFEKTNVLNTNYCQGVKVTLLGRLGLDSDEDDSTYVDAEISANSVRYETILATKLLTVASGNSGISLINITGLSIGLSDVNDF